MMISLYFVFYACPQMVNDVNYGLYENDGSRNADVKEECSSYFSNNSINEGNSALNLCLVLCSVHYNTIVLLYFFIY